MIKKVLIFVHTEYHLLIAINQILKLYSNKEIYDVKLVLQKSGSSPRLKQELDFSEFSYCEVEYWKDEVEVSKPLESNVKEKIMSLITNPPGIFIFFQEQDPLMLILSGELSQRGTEVHLYQDGLKPYVHLRYHSLGLFWGNHKQNLWMKRNGFKVYNWLSPIWSKKYAFLKGISKVFLAFPEVYTNWNKKLVEKIELLPIDQLRPVLKKIFEWNDSLMQHNDRVIFYLNQPMRDDGIIELEQLQFLQKQNEGMPLYIKNHPHTPKTKIAEYKKLNNTHIIDSKIPAELFIMNISNSIIVSMCSTAMFLDTPTNSYFYTLKIFEKDLYRLKRYRITNPTPHVKVVNSIEDIHF